MLVKLVVLKEANEISSIVLVNYYRDMWSKWPQLLHPLTKLTSNQVKFRWTDVEQKVFDEIKPIVS